MYIKIYVSIFLVIELLQFGIVFLTLLLMQSVLTYPRIVWIDSGLIKNLNLIGLLTSPESEIEVKLANYIIIVHIICSDTDIEALGLDPLYLHWIGLDWIGLDIH